ncbi:sulfotransferase [Saccharicrinis sp. FJH2]|uniref:sulfotransferase n=1 Tax=Saccharicrinis sp. FJH65 TaxID=3344659 RepID=UPI0035F28C73
MTIKKRRIALKLYNYSFKNISIIINRLRVKGKTKIFCIGLNKTGTTSFKSVMIEHGIIVGDQRAGELLLENWQKRDFRKLYRLCKTAQAFQDAPFSFPDTYKFLDRKFPGSKFILTIRDNPEQWYNSITRFHSKLWADGKRIPTKEDLMNANYIFKGRPWIGNRALFNTPENDPYKKEELINYYNQHNEDVLDYFKNRDGDLLVINVAERKSYINLCNFIGIKPIRDSFPWENKT